MTKDDMPQNQMPPKTLNALRHSIEHWERVVADPENEPIGAKWCALCQAFLGRDYDCKGCPVYTHTGKPGCRGTPYDDIMELRDDDPNDDGYGYDPDAYVAAAKRELAFLRSLLPKP